MLFLFELHDVIIVRFRFFFLIEPPRLQPPVPADGNESTINLLIESNSISINLKIIPAQTSFIFIR